MININRQGNDKKKDSVILEYCIKFLPQNVTAFCDLWSWCGPMVDVFEGKKRFQTILTAFSDLL